MVYWNMFVWQINTDGCYYNININFNGAKLMTK